MMAVLTGEAPSVSGVNLQVRTGMSVPFARHMLNNGEAPAVEPVNLQVRTGMSVPFASYTWSPIRPRRSRRQNRSPNRQWCGSPALRRSRGRAVAGSEIKMQDYPMSTFFAERDRPVPQIRDGRTRNATELDRDPFAMTPHASAMQTANAIIAPLLVVWDYKVRDATAFAAWLSTKDILLRTSRLQGDPLLAGVKYGGTYEHALQPANATTDRPGACFRTHWGYTDERTMQAMHDLCSGNYERATIVQIDLMEFVQGLKSFIGQADEEHFEQHVLLASSSTGAG